MSPLIKYFTIFLPRRRLYLLVFCCLLGCSSDNVMVFEPYDYDNNDEAKIHVLQEWLRKHDCGLSVKRDKLIFKKPIRKIKKQETLPQSLDNKPPAIEEHVETKEHIEN